MPGTCIRSRIPKSFTSTLAALALIFAAPFAAKAQAVKTEDDQAPPTARERALMLRIQQLEQRLSSLESRVANSLPATQNDASARQITPMSDPPVDPPPPQPDAVPPQVSAPPQAETASQNAAQALKSESPPENLRAEAWGSYAPGRGFKVAKTEYGDLNVSAYILWRYMNQLPPNQTFVDHLGQTRPVLARNDFQLHREMIYFDGFMFNPKFTYLAFVWTVNASNSVAVVGRLGYRFNRRVSINFGINGLPGTLSMLGSHPYWLASDRVMADEFFRPGFTAGVWLTGELFPRFNYAVMVGNNLSQLGATSRQLSRDLATSGSVWWLPTTGEFGPRGGFGDFEWHEKLATRFGASYTHSREDRQDNIATNPSPDGNNTSIRLGDSLNLFAIGSLAPGVTVMKATYQLFAEDAGIKYHGFFLQGEGYYRLVNNLLADGPLPITVMRDTGFYVQASAMLVPKKLELYGATSYIFSKFGKPHEVLGGLNWYPANNTRNLRVNLYINRVHASAVDSLFGYYTAGLTGTIVSFGPNLQF